MFSVCCRVVVDLEWLQLLVSFFFILLCFFYMNKTKKLLFSTYWPTICFMMLSFCCWLYLLFLFWCIHRRPSKTIRGPSNPRGICPPSAHWSPFSYYSRSSYDWSPWCCSGWDSIKSKWYSESVGIAQWSLNSSSG